MAQYVVSGVHKEAGVIEDLVKEGVETGTPAGLYTVESKTQLALLQQAAEKYHTVLPVLLRLTSGNQFGLDESDVEAIVAERKKPAVSVDSGDPILFRDQKTSLKRLKRELDRLDDFLERLKGTYGYEATRDLV